MEWFLQNVVSPLLLPLFIIMLLCAIAGAKPESIVKMVLDAVVAIVSLLLQLLLALVRLLLDLSAALTRILTGKFCTADNHSKGKQPGKRPGRTNSPAGKGGASRPDRPTSGGDAQPDEGD